MDVRTRSWLAWRPRFHLIRPCTTKCPPSAPRANRPANSWPDLRQRWNLPSGVIVSAGGGDNMMGAIGTSNVEPGRVTASLGTSGTIYAYSDKPAVDPKGEIAGFCDSTDAWLPLVCTMNVTVATEKPRAIFFGWSHARRPRRKSRRVPAGSDGLLFLPYLQGERTPNLPQATGVFHGLTPRTMKPAHLMRATMEGAALRARLWPGRSPQTGHRACGNPAHRRRQQECGLAADFIADIFGCTRVVTLAEVGGAALGAAIQALAAAETKDGPGLGQPDRPGDLRRVGRAAERFRLCRRAREAGRAHPRTGRSPPALTGPGSSKKRHLPWSRASA